MVERECLQHPTPPFNTTQMARVLKCFPFSDDVKRVLELFVGRVPPLPPIQ